MVLLPVYLNMPVQKRNFNCLKMSIDEKEIILLFSLWGRNQSKAYFCGHFPSWMTIRSRLDLPISSISIYSLCFPSFCLSVPHSDSFFWFFFPFLSSNSLIFSCVTKHGCWVLILIFVFFISSTPFWLFSNYDTFCDSLFTWDIVKLVLYFIKHGTHSYFDDFDI